MLILGVILAGLVLLIRPLPGILKAKASGVLVGRGHGAPRIERASDPERFRALMRKRMAEMVPGAVMVAAGVGWIVLNIVASAAASAQGS